MLASVVLPTGRHKGPCLSALRIPDLSGGNEWTCFLPDAASPISNDQEQVQRP